MPSDCLKSSALRMTGGTLSEALPLLRAHHYLKDRTADPMHVFLWRTTGGLFGDTGDAVAAVLYAAPANRYFGQGAAELTRLVRSPDLDLPLSSFVAWSLRWLKANSDLAYVLSYADPSAGHHGGIYQALGFDYVGVSNGNVYHVNPLTGERVSGRSFDQRRPEFRQGWERVRSSGKHLYIRALNERRAKLLARFGWQPLPYPKPAKHEEGRLLIAGAPKR